MILINGQKFALNNKEFTDSLFKKGGTCIGYYKVNKKSITLLDMHKEKVGVIVNKVLGLATKLEGNWWYSYGNIPLLGEYDSSLIRKEIDNIYNVYKLPNNK